MADDRTGREHDHDQTGDRPETRRRVTVREAADVLGITVEAVRGRIKRGTIPHGKADDGGVYVWLTADQTTDQPTAGRDRTTDQPRPDEQPDALVDELRDRIRYLERQVEEEREARRRADTLMARLMERVPELEASPPQEPRESRESTAESEPGTTPAPTGEPSDGRTASPVVAKGVRGMSVETATLLAGGLGILGALLGAIVGLTGDRILRSRGRVLCRTTHGEVRFLHDTGDFGEPLVDPGEPVYVSYAFGLDLFNNKETPVGLHDLSVVFFCDGEKLVDKPRDPASGRIRAGITVYEPVYLVNLPPRQWIHVELIGNLQDVEKAQTWRRVEFVGHRGTRGFFREQVFPETIKER